MLKSRGYSPKILHLCCSLCVYLIFTGCAHNDGREKAFVDQNIKDSLTFERRGDLENAIEKLKIALIVDSGNANIQKKLNQLIKTRDSEATRHYKAGFDLRDSDPLKAREKLIKAIKIKGDFPQAINELRKLQLAVALASIQERVKKVAKHGQGALHKKIEIVKDEEAAFVEDYSLDAAMSSFAKGDYDKAILEFTKMKNRYPDDQDIQFYLDSSWYNLGKNYFNKKDYKMALNSFTKVSKGFERVDEYTAKCRSIIK
jgi:tetratricopeptide (TPR) repeat protein